MRALASVPTGRMQLASRPGQSLQRGGAASRRLCPRARLHSQPMAAIYTAADFAAQTMGTSIGVFAGVLVVPALWTAGSKVAAWLVPGVTPLSLDEWQAIQQQARQLEARIAKVKGEEAQLRRRIAKMKRSLAINDD